MLLKSQSSSLLLVLSEGLVVLAPEVVLILVEESNLLFLWGLSGWLDTLRLRNSNNCNFVLTADVCKSFLDADLKPLIIKD